MTFFIIKQKTAYEMRISDWISDVLSSDLITAFINEFVYPNEDLYRQQVDGAADRWSAVPIVEDLKAKAKAEGLWNLFLAGSEFGPGLSNLDYAPLAEIMGRVTWSSEIFNCSPPDAGNTVRKRVW